MNTTRLSRRASVETMARQRLRMVSFSPPDRLAYVVGKLGFVVPRRAVSAPGIPLAFTV